MKAHRVTDDPDLDKIFEAEREARSFIRGLYNLDEDRGSRC